MRELYCLKIALMISRQQLKRAWMGVVLGYAVIRALLIWKVFAKYGVNPYLYLIIDLVSAYFYAIYSTNLVEKYLQKEFRLTTKYLLLTIFTNFLPDIYILISAKSVPEFIFRTFVQIILLLGLIAALGIIRDIKNRKK